MIHDAPTAKQLSPSVARSYCSIFDNGVIFYIEYILQKKSNTEGASWGHKSETVNFIIADSSLKIAKKKTFENEF